MYKDFLKSDEWKGTKKYLRYVKRRRCFCCGKCDDLHVHHKHYRTVGYEDGSELEFLCGFHHHGIHYFTGVKMSPDTPENEKFMNGKLKEWRINHFKNRWYGRKRYPQFAP